MHKKKNSKNPRVIGLTGGIGSGKTIATDALKAEGYNVIDADDVSRMLFARGTDGEAELCAAFPEATDDDGTLERAALRYIISCDVATRKRLDAATHPRIIAYIRERLSAVTRDTVLSAPLLFESGLDDVCDLTVCITCPLADRVRRVVNRDGITEAAARAIIATQLTDDERVRRCDIAISSDSTIEQFRMNVLNVFEQIVRL